MRRLAGPSSACYRTPHAHHGRGRAPGAARRTVRAREVGRGGPRGDRRRRPRRAGPHEGRARRRGAGGEPARRRARRGARARPRERPRGPRAARGGRRRAPRRRGPPGRRGAPPRRPRPPRGTDHAHPRRGPGGDPGRRRPRRLRPDLPLAHEAAAAPAARPRRAPQVAAALGAPVVAISGIDLANVAEVARAGAACAAVVDAVFGAGDPVENAARLAAAFEAGRSRP